MNLDELTQLTDNPNFIEGIHNYCDRWCERCPLTERCANFAVGLAQFPEGIPDDIASEEFWKGLSSVFQNTLELLQQVAEERNIDLTETPESMAEYEAMEARQAEAQEHPIANQALAYAEKSISWLEGASDLFDAKGEELTMFARLNVAGATPETQAASIEEAVEVIQWYEDFIYVKLHRALEGQIEEEADPEFYNDYPSDADGSAKIALIALDRSIGAWGQLLRHFPAEETSLLEILAHLDRLRRAVEQQFPTARAFVRPGFDTGALDD